MGSLFKLTPNGVSKLMQLTGKFHETDIVAQVLFRSWSQWTKSVEDRDTADEEKNLFDVVVSDGVHYAPAIISVVDNRLLALVDYLAVIRVRKAVSCSPIGRSTLILDNPEILGKPEGVIGNPFRDSPGENSTFGGNRVPIAALRHFKGNSVPRLRVLITYKSRLPDPRILSSRTFFVVHLLDESGEIRAYAYHGIALELYSRFETGKMYYISGIDHFRVNDCNGFYFNLPNEEIVKFSKQTRIEECHDVHGLPELTFDFIPIPKLRKLELPMERPRSWYGENWVTKFANCVDVIGVLHAIGPLEEVESKALMDSELPQSLPKREITICDQSGLLFPVVLWSYNAEEFDVVPGTVVAFRHARLTELNKPGDENEVPEIVRKVSVVTPSTIHIEPDVEERAALNRWLRSDPDLTVIPKHPEAQRAVFGNLCEP